jgi:hypothetical protein
MHDQTATVHYTTGLGAFAFWSLPIAGIAIIFWLSSLKRKAPEV